MMFQEMLISAIQSAEIPLRFEPGAEESVAKPVTEVIRAWLEAHMPADPEGAALIHQLIAEVDGAADLPQ